MLCFYTSCYRASLKGPRPCLMWASGLQRHCVQNMASENCCFCFCPGLQKSPSMILKNILKTILESKRWKEKYFLCSSIEEVFWGGWTLMASYPKFDDFLYLWLFLLSRFLNWALYDILNLGPIMEGEGLSMCKHMTIGRKKKSKTEFWACLQMWIEDFVLLYGLCGSRGSHKQIYQTANYELLFSVD